MGLARVKKAEEVGKVERTKEYTQDLGGRVERVPGEAKLRHSRVLLLNRTPPPPESIRARHHLAEGMIHLDDDDVLFVIGNRNSSCQSNTKRFGFKGGHARFTVAKALPPPVNRDHVSI